VFVALPRFLAERMGASDSQSVQSTNNGSPLICEIDDHGAQALWLTSQCLLLAALQNVACGDRISLKKSDNEVWQQLWQEGRKQRWLIAFAKYPRLVFFV